MKIHFISIRIRLTIMAVCLVCNVFAQGSYIKKYRPIADSLSNVFGIPTAVILGIAIVESSAGESRNCKLLNNHFGIVGKNNLLSTKGIKTRYKQYDSPENSFIDFAQMIARKKYYARMKGNKHTNEWIDEISKHGYSEMPAEWRKRIKQTIKKYQL